MVAGMKKHKSYLNGRQCLEIWCETNSVYKSRLKLLEKGIVNPDTGQMPSQQGVWNASYLYMIENQVEARKLIEDSWKAQGELLTDAKWYFMIAKAARYLKTEQSFEKFLRENEYLRPYAEEAKKAVKAKRGTPKGQEIHPLAVSE